MSSKKGLILKDLLNLSHYKATLLITVIFICVISFVQDGFYNFIPLMLTVMIGMISLSTFSYDEIAKSDKFILTLPTNRKEVVTAKYMLVIGLTLIGTILSFVINIILSYLVTKHAPDLMTSFLSCLGGFLGISIIESIQIPSFYKWGAERGRIQMFILVAITMALIGGIGYFLSQYIHLEINQLSNILENFGIWIMLLIIVVVYYISYQISNKIYNKKEI